MSQTNPTKSGGSRTGLVRMGCFLFGLGLVQLGGPVGVEVWGVRVGRSDVYQGWVRFGSGLGWVYVCIRSELGLGWVWVVRDPTGLVRLVRFWRAPIGTKIGPSGCVLGLGWVCVVFWVGLYLRLGPS